MPLPKILKTVGESVIKSQTSKGSASLGDTLKSLREGKGLSLEDIAAKTKIAVKTLLQIEGNKLVPGLDVITKLAKQYGVDVSTLIGKK